MKNKLILHEKGFLWISHQVKTWSWGKGKPRLLSPWHQGLTKQPTTNGKERYPGKTKKIKLKKNLILIVKYLKYYFFKPERAK